MRGPNLRTEQALEAEIQRLEIELKKAQDLNDLMSRIIYEQLCKVEG